MKQNTNLLINVINNITVTNIILVSIAIIAGSVEITVLLNKGISFLIGWIKAKNALVTAYDEFVTACNNKFNFQIDKRLEERY